MMYRKFIATILAAALAITGLSSAPARAGDNDIVKLLAGVAAVAIIGSAIAKNKRDKRREQEVTRDNFYRHDQGHGYGHRKNGHYRHGHNSHAKPLPQRVQRKLLPARCQVNARNRKGGTFPAFGRNCLRDNFHYAGSLPSQCTLKARTRRGGRHHTVYGSRCLSNHGYTVRR